MSINGIKVGDIVVCIQTFKSAPEDTPSKGEWYLVTGVEYYGNTITWLGLKGFYDGQSNWNADYFSKVENPTEVERLVYGV